MKSFKELAEAMKDKFGHTGGVGVSGPKPNEVAVKVLKTRPKGEFKMGEPADMRFEEPSDMQDGFLSGDWFQRR